MLVSHIVSGCTLQILLSRHIMYTKYNTKYTKYNTRAIQKLLQIIWRVICILQLTHAIVRSAQYFNL